MQIIHNSQSAEYRSPLGAVPTGGVVRLGLSVAAEEQPKAAYVRWWEDGAEKLEAMSLLRRSGEAYFYTLVRQLPAQPALLWYQFRVVADGGEVIYANNRDALGGLGEIAASAAAPSFQITVYQRGYHTPEWFKDSIVYQIFPDRFYGVHPDGSIPKKREDYIIHDDWYAPLAFNRHPYEDGPACNDFYGGNLDGIRARLPYLAELGVSAVYLNPVFEAYSNHKYDTGDYKKIDPMFGTEADFQRLCAEAADCGIRVILDGVFSHTGADSVYFNKYGSYGADSGAYRDPASPYRSWYQFTDYPAYNSWWGCSNLPNVNEMEPSYLDYILRSDDAVVKKWLRSGASGWRLDVADELPDAFIAMLRAAVKSVKPDAVIIGEVWEDASNKEAYGKTREYLLGHELDSVMNYPFQDAALAYLRGETGAEQFSRRMQSILENYPPEAAYALLNIAGTHDTMRLKSALGGMEEDCGSARLTSAAEETATARVKLMAFLQMTFFGVPCIYYGDEAGMQGGRDPYNRGTYPWRAVDPELREWYRALARLRNRTPCLRRGSFTPLYAAGDVYVYARQIRDGCDALGNRASDGFALCAVNRGAAEAEADFALPVPASGLRPVIGTAALSQTDGRAALSLPPYGAALYLTTGG